MRHIITALLILTVFVTVADAKKLKNKNRVIMNPRQQVTNNDLIWSGSTQIQSNWQYPFDSVWEKNRGFHITKVYHDTNFQPGDIIISVNNIVQSSNYWGIPWDGKYGPRRTTDLIFLRDEKTNRLKCKMILLPLLYAYRLSEAGSSANIDLLSILGIEGRNTALPFGLKIVSVRTNSLGKKIGLTEDDILIWVNQILIENLDTVKTIGILKNQSMNHKVYYLNLEILREERIISLRGTIYFERGFPRFFGN
jgi:hypothetical protein